MNNTIEKFVKEFENKFKNLLLTPPKGEPILYTSFFKIYNDKPKNKYSDWDIKTWARTEEISFEDIKQFDEFIRAYSGFSDVGLFMAFSDSYFPIFQHVAHSSWLQFMGFMPNEPTAPFLDLWIAGIFREEDLVRIYKNKNENEMLKWAAITAWRKIKNQDIDGARQIFRIYLNPKFPNKEDLFISNPALFVNQNIPLETTEELIKFLRS
jgi:hypothetical protein